MHPYKSKQNGLQGLSVYVDLCTLIEHSLKNGRLTPTVNHLSSCTEVPVTVAPRQENEDTFPTYLSFLRTDLDIFMSAGRKHTEKEKIELWGEFAKISVPDKLCSFPGLSLAWFNYILRPGNKHVRVKSSY